LDETLVENKILKASNPNKLEGIDKMDKLASALTFREDTIIEVGDYKYRLIKPGKISDSLQQNSDTSSKDSLLGPNGGPTLSITTLVQKK